MNDSVPLVRMRQLEAPIRFLSAVGAPIERLMTRSLLPAQALDDPEAYASSHLIYRFLDLAADSEGIEDLGVRAAEQVTVGNDGWTAPALASAHSLRDALEQLVSLALAESPEMQFAIRSSDAKAWIEYRGSASFQIPGAFHAEHYMVVLLTRFVARALGFPWRPREVHLQARAPFGLTSWLPTTRFRVSEAMTRVSVPLSRLESPVAGDPLDREAKVPPSREDFVGGLRRALSPYLPQGLPGIQIAAEIAGISSRTLQRRLESFGLSYSELVKQIRRERACHLIRHTDMRLLEIAYELGFSDPAHFTRAFRSWVGMTPSRYREH